MRPIDARAIWAEVVPFDGTSDGRPLTMLNLHDIFSRECVAIEVQLHHRPTRPSRVVGSESSFTGDLSRRSRREPESGAWPPGDFGPRAVHRF